MKDPFEHQELDRAWASAVKMIEDLGEDPQEMLDGAAKTVKAVRDEQIGEL